MAINKVGSKGIEDGAVAAIDFADETVSSDKFADTTIANAKLSNSSITAAGASISLGGSATFNNQFVDWQSKVTSDGSTVTTMESGKGYFIDNTSASGIVKLPASASIGDFVAIKDYAGNFGTNSLTIQRNGHSIQGTANDSRLATNRASVVLVYADSTKGWLYWEESNVASLEHIQFVSATGGTVATSGDFKIHSFTGDGCFVVSQGNIGTNTAVDYVVVAGGGGGGSWGGGGGGAGGYRESSGNSGCYTASPLATPVGITVTAQTYPITVGAGGANAPGYPARTDRTSGSNSVFSTITSAGGGRGGSDSSDPAAFRDGGSGGGAYISNPIGNGNTPPVSPPQGSNGGTGAAAPNYIGGGGGGAGAVGGNASNTPSQPKFINAGPGGNGTPSNITGSDVTRAGGGGGGGNDGDGSGQSGAQPTGGSGGGGNGGYYPSTSGANGTANTGGGGGAAGATSPTGNTAGPSGAGGKGIVILRYKFQ